MSSRFNTQTLSRDVEWFNLQFDSDRYSLSSWQRDDCWSPEYQKELIKSILCGIDIPKFYIGQIANTDTETIMDGGHRTRSINRFMNNDFSININGKEIEFEKGMTVLQACELADVEIPRLKSSKYSKLVPREVPYLLDLYPNEESLSFSKACIPNVTDLSLLL